MKKIKKYILLVLSLVMLMTASPIQAKNEEDLSYWEDLYKIELKSVIAQLEEQDAMAHLPIYKAILDSKYELVQSNFGEKNGQLQSTYNAYMPNGGSIYYSDYLGYGVEVSQVYLNTADSNKYMNGTLTSSVLNVVIGHLPIIGTLLSYLNLRNDIVFRNVRNGTGRLYITKSKSLESASTVIFHWSTAPNVTYYSGARINYK